MEEDLKQLKSVLRSVVVSSAAEMDTRSLARDYQNMMGEDIPAHKFGYEDISQFVREKCQDCFLFHGPTENPKLTLIVPQNLQHIDKFVQKQKRDKKIKYRMKRHSVQQSMAIPLPSKSYRDAMAEPKPTPNITNTSPTTTATVFQSPQQPTLLIQPSKRKNKQKTLYFYSKKYIHQQEM